MVDVSMADGALSWLAMVAAALLRRRRRAAARRAAAGGLADLLPPLRVRRRLGLAGRAGAEVLAGVVPRRRPRGPDRAPSSSGPARDAHAQVEEIFRERTRAQWEAFAREHDCCLEPVLELDEALDSELVARARDGRRARPARRRAPGAPARHAGQARPHARRARAPARARRSASTPRRCCAAPATRRGGDRRAARRAAPRPARREDRAERDAEGVSRRRGARAQAPARPGRTAPELLKMSELAERSGVSPGTIRYYLREGLLGAARTSCARAATWPTTRPSTSSGSS